MDDAFLPQNRVIPIYGIPHQELIQSVVKLTQSLNPACSHGIQQEDGVNLVRDMGKFTNG
jgi:hypothetical protein